MNSNYLFSILCFLFYLSRTISLKAQNVPLGTAQFEQQAVLNYEDEVLDSTHYFKYLQMDIKAGEGIFLYMVARDFVPQIYTMDTMALYWNLGITEKYGDDAYVSYSTIVAQRDTAFIILYSTMYNYNTGAFDYGVRKLSVEQMQYNIEVDFCQRLTYLINHWQCFWKLLPVYTQLEGVKVPESTNNTLMKGGTGFLNKEELSDYKEIIYSGNDPQLAKNQYEYLVAKTTHCLDDQWDIISEVINDEIGDGVRYITNFTIKGGVVDQQSYSFRIEYDSNLGKDQTFIQFY